MLDSFLSFSRFQKQCIGVSILWKRSVSLFHRFKHIWSVSIPGSYFYWYWSCPIFGHWELIQVGPWLLLTEYLSGDEKSSRPILHIHFLPQTWNQLYLQEASFHWWPIISSLDGAHFSELVIVSRSYQWIEQGTTCISCWLTCLLSLF